MRARTRISGLHVSDKKPTPGESVSFSGYLQLYDAENKRWEPLRGKLLLFIDGIKKREFHSDNYGQFEIDYIFPYPGKYNVEVRFEGGAKTKASMAGLKVEVITGEQKKRIARLVRIFIVLFLLFMILVSAILIVANW
ncbi:MAG: hypothetical protein H0Z28_08410 [Archaeoglobus sp.]|nr:hypothetical protein [Archaeoglobus sp.]